MPLSEWTEKVMTTWDQCYDGLKSEITHDINRGSSSNLLSVIRSDNKGRGVFIFNVYSLADHESFYRGLQRTIIEEEERYHALAQFLFIPSIQAVLLIKEIHRADHISLTELLDFARKMKKVVEVFLKVHCQHLIDGDLVVIPIILAPQLQLTDYPSDLCCITTIFFNVIQFDVYCS